jgi:hypothetical protein
MTNREADYFSEFDPADPLGAIDHALICDNVLSELTSAGSVNEALAYEQDYQMHFDKKAYDLLLNTGSYLIPLEQNGKRSDDNMRQRIFLSGMLIALKTVDAVCVSIELDPEVFREVWNEGGLATIIDTSADIFKDKTSHEKYAAVGDGIVLMGQDFLYKMKPEYQKLIDDVGDEYAGINEPNLLKASYGYVLGSAQLALSRILNDVKYRAIVSEADVDKGSVYLLEEPIPVQFVRDDDIAEEIDNMAFYGEYKNTEAFLGQEIEYFLDREDEIVEILKMLALVQYPNELGNGALDQNGEAFFMGEILGLVFGEKHCEALEVRFDHASRRWRKNTEHSKLNRLEFPPDERMPDVDRKVMNTLLTTELSTMTHGLLDKISDDLDYDEDEAIAFKNGLQYVLESYKKTIRGCIDTKINQRAKLATASLDEELRNLLDE